MSYHEKTIADETLNKDQFKMISEIAHKEAGLVLVESKVSMISARLSKRARELGLRGIQPYLELLQTAKRESELPHLLSTLTTNVSHFFRESHHFEQLSSEISPKLKERAEKGDAVRIWSAGCSNGQELYSIAMTLSESFPEFRKYNVKLLGTDIDPKVVETAERGEYTQAQMKGVKEAHKKEYFTYDQESDSFKVKKGISDYTTFKRLNLMSNWPMRQAFDVIFCRNVVIYFDEETQDKLWKRFRRNMKSESWLFVGHSERIKNNQETGFQPCGVTAYQRSNEVDPEIAVQK